MQQQAAEGEKAVRALRRPRATLLIPDGGVIATRVHYETLNDAMFLVRVTALAGVLCLASVVLLSLTTANVDLRLGIMAITSYPRLLFSSAVWTSTSVFSAILVAWFVVFCVFCHVVRLHFNTTDPPRDWDDRNGEWSVVELDVRTRPKQPTEQMNSPDSLQSQPPYFAGASSPPAPSAASACSDCDAASSLMPTQQWKLCVLPAQVGEVALLTLDRDYQAWRVNQKSKRE
ncbi:hypothetical protein IWW36_001004 [Coemansia brasiliensis]|uniref:Uncharacterized protein n=1 Tax=Coemansia brasiliensis TaxID=2650707 RepID=A0A9W8IHH3_9FUNG|nr:hypothetical protein IWW36_001004 [Coemansia brasiliensis]